MYTPFGLSAVDKKIETVAIRMSEEMRKQMNGIASIHALSESDYVRLLIERDIAAKADEYRMLQSVFGDKVNNV